MADPSPRSSTRRWTTRRLVIGGGRAADYPRLRATDISLDESMDARPHILADLRRMPIASESFGRIVMEYIPYTAITSRRYAGLNEAVRVLRPGARLTIDTGDEAPAEKLAAHLRRIGMRSVTVGLDPTGAVRIDGVKRKPRLPRGPRPAAPPAGPEVS